eukprot:jgi/Antlo1/1720/1871
MDEDFLNTKWTFWYDYHSKRSSAQEDWQQSLHEICTVESIPMLLYALENIEPLENWPSASNIHFFREDIRPAWEDEKNKEGGKWILEFNKADTSANIQEVWMKTVALCVSEILKDEIICGCVFSPRRFVNRFSVWTSKKDKSVIEVGNQWKNEVGAHRHEISFRVNQDALQGGPFWNKSIYNL